tara:strand:- start:33004 stop:33264 length:261 start_codon:yes stop_codon:yes gene_type:complete
MAVSEVVRARIDPALKKEATSVLSDMGLSVSDAIRMMLTRIANEHALPFEVRVPNKDTQKAIAAKERGEVESFANIADLMTDLKAD